MDPQHCLQGIFAPVQHSVRDDPDAGVERGGGRPHPGDLQALREQTARHDHGEDWNQGTVQDFTFFPFFKKNTNLPVFRNESGPCLSVISVMCKTVPVRCFQNFTLIPVFRIRTGLPFNADPDPVFLYADQSAFPIRIQI
jgi:hypothetical protein